MALMNFILAAVMATTVGLSMRFFSPQQLEDRFAEGQSLYALGDYPRAIGHYRAIIEVQSNLMIDVETVWVTVDDYLLPIRVAATYQLANSYNKQGMDKFLRAGILLDEQKEEEAEVRHAEALADLNTSLEYFEQILRDDRIDERTRVMAQYQKLETHFQLRQYERVIEEGNRLLRDFPNSVYETATNYDVGWSHYELQEYEEAIQRFNEVLILSPRGSYADRALFQIAECYAHLGAYDAALEYLDRLIQRYDFSRMSEQEIIEMTTLRLKGLVQETTRELVAKAQLMKGDIYEQKGEIEKALEAYAVVPREYAAEPTLVQNSYIRSAELIHRQRGTTAAIDAYKHAIENTDNKRFEAQIQLTIARLLFDEGMYDRAVEEYRIYLSAYGDVAERIGFGKDKALFRLAQSYQFRGLEMVGDDPDGAAPILDRAVSTYRQLLEEHPTSSLVPEVFLGLGFSTQAQGHPQVSMSYYRRLVDDYPEHPATPTALLQLARLDFEAGDYPGARVLYHALIENYSDAGLLQTALMEQGLTYQRMGDVSAAIQAFEAVAPEWGQWPMVQLQLAELHATEGRHGRAEEVVRGALEQVERGPLRSQLYYAAGRALFAQGHYDEAIRALDAALDPEPEAGIVENVLFMRGAAHYEHAKELDAAGDFSLAQSHYESSLTDLQRLLESDPALHLKDSAFRTLGASMIRLNQTQEASRYYEEIIASSTDPQEQATFQMLLAELFYDMQDFERAQQHANKLLQLEFDDDNEAGYFRKERAYVIIGNSLLQQQQYLEAAENFAIGLQHYPRSGESANMAFSRGLAAFSAGDYQAALSNLVDYIQRFPSHPSVIHGQYYLAHSHQALTQFGRAAEAFAALVDRYPGSAYHEEALFLIGENYYNAQDFARSAAAYRRYLERYPTGQYSDQAQYALAWAYFEQETMERGVAAMETLVDRYPHSEFASRAQFTIGDYYYNLREYDKALAAYEKVVADYPGSGEAFRADALIRELSEIQASLEYAEVMRWFDQQKYAEAIAGFERLVARYQGTYTALAALCNMGMAYENMRRWRDAVENYERVLELAEDDPETRDVVSFAQQHRDWIVENRL